MIRCYITPPFAFGCGTNLKKPDTTYNSLHPALSRSSLFISPQTSQNYFFATFVIFDNLPPAIFFSLFISLANSLSCGASTSSGFTFEQQFGHFVAALLIEVLQNGHERVVTGCLLRILFTTRTNKNLSLIHI